MANEIAAPYSSTGSTLYCVILNSVGQIYNATSLAFETPTAANWTSAKYCLSLTEQSTTQIYERSPPTLAAGVYYVSFRLQAGGSPATTDTNLGTGKLDWDGTAEIGDFGTNIAKLLGTAWLTPGTAGTPDVNAKQVGGTAQTAGDIYALDTAIASYIDTEVAAIKAKTDNLPASPAAIGSAMTLASGAITAAVVATDAIDADALAADALTEIFTKIWTTALTEGYAADGAAPTPSQFMFMLWSFLTEFGISGVTYTAKKLDGSTSSMTFTLDSSTAPTAIDRAT